MVQPTRPPANELVRRLRLVYNLAGFSKGYNFALWVVLGGTLLGFTLARLPYLDFYGIFCRRDADPSATLNAAPGECFYLLQAPNNIGMILHLGSILPTALLAVFQFVPAIRHRALLVHRVNGYIVVLLSVVSVAGALMIARHSFGGGLDVQSSIGFLAIIFLGANFMAYVNIKRLQVEEHRAWMMRAWVYAGSVITTRFILFSGAAAITRIGGFFLSLPCAKVAWLLGNQENTLSVYPDCGAYFDGSDAHKNIAVLGSIHGNLAERASALDMTFGTAHWLALLVHVMAVEIYLHLTPAEHERLRGVSYQRQLEAGMRNPGRAGWTAHRLSDVGKEPKADRAYSSTKEDDMSSQLGHE
ncbi:Uu.00g139440.m01.CDS01 [Anthostomella pinea]|uniref:Uu.00g139440.m01.CDS01 n=1 Tax=Anthostomella pinea TaxID=933095 RepID=A0AAI8VPW5_9PEZI|nr:Uu.00g139440.m01.CDS01 [Anthostomella pinea]